MTLHEYLAPYGSYMIGHLKNGCSRKKDIIILPKAILDEIKQCFSDIRKLNEFIYTQYFHELLDYLDIKNNSIRTMIEDLYTYTSFEDHNIISRLDLFFTETGVKIAEINHDTPGGWIETYFLNAMEHIEGPYINPNKDFAELFGNAFVRRGITDICLLTGLGSRLDKKMLSFLSKILDYYNVSNKTGIFEGMTYNNNMLSMGDHKLHYIHKDIPIDRLCNNYDPEISSLLIEKIRDKSIKISNNPVGYIFQLKSYFAFLYEHKAKFPGWVQDIIFAHIPKTKRLYKEDKDIYNKQNRVIKHVNKRLGDDIYIGNKTKETERKQVITKSNPDDWIIQERFEVLPILDKYINFGVYGIDTHFGGVYTRISDLGPKTTAVDDYTCPLFFSI